MVVLLIMLNFSLFLLLPTYGNAESGQNPPRSSYQFTLAPGEYAYVYLECDTSVAWEFSGSNTYVGIEAWVFNEDNFDIYEDGGNPTGWEVSTGGNYADSGTQFVNDCDTWYLVVINTHASETTTVTVDAIFYGADCGSEADDTDNSTDSDADYDYLLDPDFWIIFIIVMIVIIVIVVIAKR